MPLLGWSCKFEEHLTEVGSRRKKQQNNFMWLLGTCFDIFFNI